MKKNNNNKISKRKAGRPVEKTVGYKARVGLRYVTKSGKMVDTMAQGDTFTSISEAGRKLDEALAAGEVNVWGRCISTKFIPMKSF
jgi:hypothetical protein